MLFGDLLDALWTRLAHASAARSRSIWAEACVRKRRRRPRTRRTVGLENETKQRSVPGSRAAIADPVQFSRNALIRQVDRPWSTSKWRVNSDPDPKERLYDHVPARLPCLRVAHWTRRRPSSVPQCSVPLTPDDLMRKSSYVVPACCITS